jgi:hypothetical protein
MKTLTVKVTDTHITFGNVDGYATTHRAAAGISRAFPGAYRVWKHGDFTSPLTANVLRCLEKDIRDDAPSEVRVELASLDPSKRRIAWEIYDKLPRGDYWCVSPGLPRPVEHATKADFEKLEARVAAHLESHAKSKRCENIEKRLTALEEAERKRERWLRLGRSFYYGGFDWATTRDRTVTVAVRPNKYRKLWLLLCGDGSCAFYTDPSPSYSRNHVKTPTGCFGFKHAAEILREYGTKELVIKRRTGVKMDVLTKWLTGLVNEQAPVMTITSDPGFVE